MLDLDIQRSYPNSFGSIWEYVEAFKIEKIDFGSVVGPVCPICGGVCGYRRIGDYLRRVKDLVGARSGLVPVARFQCLGTAGHHPTFSLLPHQLVPYLEYTFESMVQALLAWRAYWKEGGGSGSGYGVSERLDERMAGESGVTSWRLRCWALVFQQCLRRWQSLLAGEYEFAGVCYFASLPWVLDELHGYFSALSRGPPVEVSEMDVCAKRHAERWGGFLVGVPSQGR